jgi:acyl-CoA thioesterase FadM
VNYEIHNEDGKLIVTGETKQAFIDAKSMRPTRIPVFLKEEVDKFFDK